MPPATPSIDSGESRGAAQPLRASLLNSRVRYKLLSSSAAVSRSDKVVPARVQGSPSRPARQPPVRRHHPLLCEDAVRRQLWASLSRWTARGPAALLDGEIPDDGEETASVFGAKNSGARQSSGRRGA